MDLYSGLLYEREPGPEPWPSLLNQTKAQDMIPGPALCSRPGQESISLSLQGCPCRHVQVVLDYLHWYSILGPCQALGFVFIVRSKGDKIVNMKNATLKLIYKWMQNPEPDRDQVLSINASSRVLPVHAGRDIPARTGIYSLALVWSRGQGQESCLEPWSSSRERARSQVLTPSHTASQSTSLWSLLLGFSNTLGRRLSPVQALLALLCCALALLWGAPGPPCSGLALLGSARPSNRWSHASQKFCSWDLGILI